MPISFKGQLTNDPQLRAGFIGCGSHAFRNLYPTFQFTPVDLLATCDLDLEKAKAFARQFGARTSYDDYHRLLEDPDIDAVFICTGYDPQGRPLYPRMAIDCLKAGKHVWMEKPPAASCAEITDMQQAAKNARKNVMVGFKKMFFPANEKAHELMHLPEFGRPHFTTLQYPQYVPTPDEFHAYKEGNRTPGVMWFLDHLCHPVSLLVYLLGMPRTLHFQRSSAGAGVATFTFDDGALASIALTHGAASNGGMERTVIVGETGHHITVDNNTTVTLHRKPKVGYGDTPSFYAGATEHASAVWHPEFSLGQLYNKGLFLLGYYAEINEFALSILEQRDPCKAHLAHAHQITRIFEAFAEGPGREIPL
jgi:predicted dehydrogenase